MLAVQVNPHVVLRHTIPKCAAETCIYQSNDQRRRQKSDSFENLTVDEERDVTVAWLDYLNQQFDYRSRTFFLAVSYLDTTLSRARVSPKYIRCLATASFMLAAKVYEETEDQPLLRELIKATHGEFSSNDLIRMESLITRKLEWNLSPVTPDSLLVNVYECCTGQALPSPHDELPEPIAFAITVMQDCIATSSYLRFSVSTLAIASLVYVIKRRGVAALLDSSDSDDDDAGQGTTTKPFSIERSVEAERVWRRIEDLFTTYASHIDRESVDECVDEMVVSSF